MSKINGSNQTTLNIFYASKAFMQMLCRWREKKGEKINSWLNASKIKFDSSVVKTRSVAGKIIQKSNTDGGESIEAKFFPLICWWRRNFKIRAFKTVKGCGEMWRSSLNKSLGYASALLFQRSSLQSLWNAAAIDGTERKGNNHGAIDPEKVFEL